LLPASVWRIGGPRAASDLRDYIERVIRARNAGFHALVVKQITGGRVHSDFEVNNAGDTETRRIPVRKCLMRKYLDGLLPSLAGQLAVAVEDMVIAR
jgi:hypothetical protein